MAVLVLMSICFGMINCQANEERINLFSFVDQGLRTNVWYLSTDLCDKMPKWNPETDELPLSPELAMKIARQWVQHREQTTNCWFEDLSICPVYHDSVRFGHVYYYKLFYEVASPQYHAACILMMDGRVLEPTIEPLPHLNKKGLNGP